MNDQQGNKSITVAPDPIPTHLLDWLFSGDVAIQYQAHLDLLGEERPDLRARIATEGWGTQFLQARQPEGHWGEGFYQPKWISSHYTLLDLKHLGIAPDNTPMLEGIAEYLANGYAYRAAELSAIAGQAQEFILHHRLFRSDRTGDIISSRFLRLSYPSRWYYDILRALDYFRNVGAAYDPRMQDALDVLMHKRRKDGTWLLQARHPGQTHFDMETPGQPSRWNTLRALRVYRHFFNEIGLRHASQ